MAIILDDTMKKDIEKRNKKALEVNKMSEKEKEEYYERIRQEIEEDEKWLAENDHTGVDWYAPSEGMYTIGKTEFAEDEYDPSISLEDEEELIRESEENCVDSGYLEEDELKNFFNLEEDIVDNLIERTREGNRISQELFGIVGTENLSRNQINTVRKMLGIGPVWYD